MRQLHKFALMRAQASDGKRWYLSGAGDGSGGGRKTTVAGDDKPDLGFPLSGASAKTFGEARKAGIRSNKVDPSSPSSSSPGPKKKRRKALDTAAVRGKLVGYAGGYSNGSLDEGQPPEEVKGRQRKRRVKEEDKGKAEGEGQGDEPTGLTEGGEMGDVDESPGQDMEAEAAAEGGVERATALPDQEDMGETEPIDDFMIWTVVGIGECLFGRRRST